MRAGTDAGRYPVPAADLARRPPDVIVSVSSAILRVLRGAVPDVPMVFVAVSNLDGQGFVASLSRPGANDQLRQHLGTFVQAYNFARRLKILKRLTPYEFICKAWARGPDRFRLEPLHQVPGLNI